MTRTWLGMWAVLQGCTVGPGAGATQGSHGAETGDPAEAGTGEASAASVTTTGESTTATTADGSEGDTADSVALDVSPPDTETSDDADVCHVVGELDAVGDCEEVAPPDSFEPEVQWSWVGPDGDAFCVVTPLVANLTDDNGDGSIDLCDTPDIVVVAGLAVGIPGGPNANGRLYVLDGATGEEHFHIGGVSVSTTPALGDIDGDGVADIVSANGDGDLVAFDHEGIPLFTQPAQWPHAGLGSGHLGVYGASIALADVDNDGDVEIIAANFIADHQGRTLVVFDEPSGFWSATVPADLDDDGDLEIVLGHAAYHHDGTPVFVTDLEPGFPQVANLDADPQPEILLINAHGVSLIDHDGTVQFSDRNPTGADNTDASGEVDPRVLLRPATVHDFDGDGRPEFAVSSGESYSVLDPDASVQWSATVADLSGVAAGTAFDFLGDGGPEAMYGDERFFRVYDSVGGGVVLEGERSSATLTEYPVVADVDNDGSAEIVVTSSPFRESVSPTVQVIRDAEDRWIQPRRIWNQHTYHVTNVREDGTIPTVEPHHWELLNTFRTNAQIGVDGVCDPGPAG